MSKFSWVSVDDNLIILPDRIIQISNISRVSSFSLTKPWKLKILTLVITLLLYVGGQDNLRWGLSQDIKTMMTYGAFGFGALCLYFFAYKKFGIKIQTNGGTTDALITQDEYTADRLFVIISYFINDVHEIQGKAFTINNNLQITQGDKIMGDKFSEIRDSVITNRSINS